MLLRKTGISLLILMCSLSIHAQLNASFTVSQSQGCSPMQVRFTNTSAGNPDSCFWQLGTSGNTSTLLNPVAIYNAPGVYTVTLTVYKGAQSSSASQNIKIFKDPVADFTSDLTGGCEPVWIRFTESVTPGDAPVSTVKWDFGDGIVDSLHNPGHRYDFYGFKAVSLIVTDQNGCKNTIVKPNFINVLDRPKTDILSANNENCKTPATVNFTAPVVCTVPIQNYNWNFGDGGTGTGSAPAHTYNAQGMFTVRLITRAANGCYDTIKKNDFVRLNPIIADFNADTMSGCVPQKIMFRDSTNFTNITTFWDFRDGITSTDKYPEHTFYGAGTYNVTLISTLRNTTCSHTVSKPVRIDTSPVADFSMSNTLSCKDELVQFTNLSTGAVKYTWYFINADNGHMDSSSQVNPSYFFSSTYNNDFHVKLKAESANGCVSEAFRSLAFSIIRDSVSIITVDTAGCSPYTADFDAYINGPWPAGSVTWNFGDGNTASGPNVSHTFNSTGIYTVRMMVNIPGCDPVMRTRVVMVGNRDNTYAGHMDKFDVCTRSDSIHFTVTGGLPGTGFTWNLGDNFISFRDFYYRYTIPSAPLKYQVQLIASNMGCSDTSYVGDVLVRPPLAMMTVLPPCNTGRTVTFINTSMGHDSLVMDMGDGTIFHSIPDTFSHTYPDTGLVFIATLKVFNGSYGCEDSVKRPVRFNPRILSMTYNKTSGCNNLMVRFQAVGYEATDSIYWEFSDEPGVYLPTVATTHNFDAPGVYSAKMFIKNISGCLDSVVRRNAFTVSELTGNLNIQNTGGCVTRDFIFSADINSAFSNVNMYQWTVEDTVIITDTAYLSYHFKDTGIAYIKLKVTNQAGCSLELRDTLDVRERFANFSMPIDTICRGLPLQFQNLSAGNGLRYLWNFGDNTTSALRDPAHGYSDTGTYIVTFTATDPTGCSDNLKDTVRVTTLSVDFTADNRYRSCPELLVNFSMSSTTTHFDHFVWDFGNGNESVGWNTNPSTIYTYSDSFDIKLKAYDAYGCIDSVLKNDHVIISGPRGDFSFTPLTGCTPVAVEFTGNFNNAKSITWDFGDGAVHADSTLPFRDTITHRYISNGNFTPSLILQDNDNCIALIPARSVVQTGAIQTHIEQLAAYVCNSGTVEMRDSSVFVNGNYPVSFEWYVNDVLSGTNSDFSKLLSYDPQKNPQEIKLLTTSLYGCKSADSVLLKFYRTPSINVDTAKVICSGESVLLHVSGTNHYNWNPAAVQINSNTFSVSPNASGYYYVTAYEDSASCNVTDSVFVKVITQVDAFAVSDTFMCYGDSVQLPVYAANTSNNISRFYWTPSSYIEDVHLSAPYVFPPVDKDYTVTVSNGLCIPQRFPVHVSVKQLPTVHAGEDTIIIAGMTTFLEGSSPNTVSYNWTPANSLSCPDCETAPATPQYTTQYYVTVTDSFGCMAYDSTLVRVIEKCNDNAVFVPNLFTPNANGRNDVLRVLGPGVDNVLSFRIYDRWGKMLFESNDIQRGWDGTYEGQMLQPGVYVYFVEVRCINNQVTYKKGDVTLLR